MMDYIFDSETFPNCYQVNFKSADGRDQVRFEISDRRVEYINLRNFVLWLKTYGHRLVGFNNLAFDYPILHAVLTSGMTTPRDIYEFAMAVINTENKFAFMVRPSDCWVPQIDLFKVHHFDNKARMTGLKTLEFNMRLPNISEMPFPVGTVLTSEQMTVLSDYCMDDVEATRQFYWLSKEKLEFREQLSQKYQRDFMNYSDVKIGKEIFIISLEAAGVPCYTYGNKGRQPKQSPRNEIRLADCVPSFIAFENSEFKRIHLHFIDTIITQTKGAFDDLSARVGGLDFVFGTGGLHASVEKEQFKATADTMIYDIDVTGLYPAIAIEQGYYPEHLGPTFVEVYKELRRQRAQHKKGTAENGMLKLAMNGVYGESNDHYSVFYDPLFTMKITIGGQLMLAMLAEQLLKVPGLRLIQCNTDGITMHIPRTAKFIVDAICAQWEKLTRLSLESAEYDLMAIADVNSYVARKTDGTVKRKGRYEYDLDWHQDASALVIPKITEKVLLEGVSIRETLHSWPDRMDFMLRVKANRGTQLGIEHEGVFYTLDRTQRYMMSKAGFTMVKMMPPLAKTPDKPRRIAVQKGFKVVPCNDIKDSADYPIDFDWYETEIEKLVLGVL